MGGKLLYRDGNGRDASVDLAPDGAFLGRAADCIVRTDDAMVSRKNCKISFAGGRWMVEDLGSSNGTFVNEVRVQKQALSHADVVRCGTLQVRFVETADAQPVGGGGGKPRTMSIPAQGAGASVQVDPAFAGGGALDPAALVQQKEYELAQVMQERDALASRLREASQELEAATHRNEGNQTELQRLRAENLAYRDRLGEVQREKSLQDDEIHALTKVGNELKDELDALKREHLGNKQRVDELTDELSARERQLERAHEDVQRAKQMMEEMRGKLAELGKTKDEGWKELNARIAELDQLREVISEQERILEERKVGLMALESAVKDGRADKERTQREMIAMKNERDELRDKVIRQQHNLEALEEEQRRLARMLSDGGSGGGGGGDNSEHVRLAAELREVKVELRKVEAERTRLGERLETAERERAQLEEQLSRLDLERASAVQSKGTLDAARARLEEKLAKAEAARAKAEEALAAADKAREAASQAADRAKVDAERERKRAAELERELEVTRESMAGATPEMLAEAAHPQLLDTTSEIQVPAEARMHQLEEEIARLEKELHARAPAPGGNGQLGEIKKKAEEAYSGINDALSELRTNILLAKDLVAEHGKAVPDHDAARTLEDAINVSVDRTEDAKGLLRALREVIES